MRICSHLLNKFLTEKFIFCVLICASKQTENYSEEENNLFFEKLCCFFIHIFRKSLCNLQIFYRSVFRCKVLRPFVLYLFEVQSTVLVPFSSEGEALREKNMYSELFWSIFSRIWTEYGEKRGISPYSIRMRENTDQNNSEYGHVLRSENVFIQQLFLTREGKKLLRYLYKIAKPVFA